MLTRCFDACLAALHVPFGTYVDANDYNASSISDSVLNCKDTSGNFRTLFCPTSFNSSGAQSVPTYVSSATAYSAIPFCLWVQSNTLSTVGHNLIFPDETSTAPTYEDYSFGTYGTSSGWTAYSSAALHIAKTYDSTTGEFVVTVEAHYQNTSGASKTVYGLKIATYHPYRTSATATSNSSSVFLLCREQFNSALTVPALGILTLSFTYRVGRQGISGTGGSGS